MVHTGQNFTPELREFFFRDLKLRKPDYELDIDTSSYGKEVSDVVRKSDELLEKVKPDALLVLGDTYSGLAVLPEIGRASCRERVCQSVSISGVGVAIKKKNR